MPEKQLFRRLATAVAVLELAPHARNLIWIRICIRICIRCTSWLTTKLVPTMGVHFTCDFERLERLVYSIGGNGDSSFECVQKIGMGPYTKSIPELVKNSTHSGRIIGIFKIDCEGCSSTGHFPAEFRRKDQRNGCKRRSPKSRIFDLSNGGKVRAKIWFVEHQSTYCLQVHLWQPRTTPLFDASFARSLGSSETHFLYPWIKHGHFPLNPADTYT